MALSLSVDGTDDLTEPVPSSVLSSLCKETVQELRDAGIEGRPLVVTLDRTVSFPDSGIELLRDLYVGDSRFKGPGGMEREQAEIGTLTTRLQEFDLSVSVSIPNGGACSWRVLHDVDDLPLATGLVIEVTSPAQFGFIPAGEHVGVIAISSWRGEPGASWYWIPLDRPPDGEWRAKEPKRLRCYDCLPIYITETGRRGE